MMSFASLNLFVACLLAQHTAPVSSFGVVPSTFSPRAPIRSLPVVTRNSGTVIKMSEEMNAEDKETAEKVEKIGNLVADDEWMGLNMELSELVRVAILEDVKQKTRDFIGDENYKVGDITKEIDSRVKDEVAKIRGKEEYELGDLVTAMDELSKDMTCQLTGKEDYEVGDLTIEIDARVKKSVESFCGLEPGQYQAGDLTKEVDNRVRGRVEEFIGKEYEFGDITKEIENRRRDWVKEYLGEEAAAKYQFGDITKKALTGFTGKDDYEFGDVTKKIMGDLFGKRKRGGQS
mmetsp:Transcript_20698/g.29218  ORF Transcript_20698/g.29218 Transcript_20698/m.29218 type:complete len:290 (+) Transcript_20698:117-986(+)